jgi:hypothetical protein
MGVKRRMLGMDYKMSNLRSLPDLQRRDNFVAVFGE